MEMDEEYIDNVKNLIEQKDAENVKALLIDLHPADIAELRDAGFIRFSKKIDNLNVQVRFIQAGETAIHIQDFRNLGYQYLKYYGGAYFECENCGLTVKAQSPAKGRPQKYCPSCAVEVKTRQTVNAVMRCRNALKS